MHVLHISGAVTMRGGEVQLLNLYRALDRKGIKQTVYCPASSALATYCKVSGMNLFIYSNTMLLGMVAANQLKKIIRKEKFDIIHLHDPSAHTIGYLSSLLGVRVPMLLSRKVVFRIKSSLLTQLKYNASCIKKIVCVSDAVQKLVAASVKNNSRVCVVHEGIEPLDASLIKPISLPDAITSSDFDFLIGYIAALTDEKDHETFLQVAKAFIIKKINAGFIIAGSGKNEATIRKRIQDLGLERNIFMIGFCKDVPGLMKRLDALLFTSLKEGLPVTLLESFFMRLPVVATNAGGIPELIRNDETGFLSDVKNVTGLSEKLELLLRSEEVKKRITENAYKHAAGFTSDIMAEKMIRVYKEVL